MKSRESTLNKQSKEKEGHEREREICRERWRDTIAVKINRRNLRGTRRPGKNHGVKRKKSSDTLHHGQYTDMVAVGRAAIDGRTGGRGGWYVYVGWESLFVYWNMCTHPSRSHKRRTSKYT